jgi:hypothetical protein
MVAIRVTATRRGLNGVTSKLSDAALFARVYDSVSGCLSELKENLIPLIPFDQGIAQESIYTVINGYTLNDIEGVVGSDADYFPNLEYGRRAGAQMPPSLPIEEWAERHGIEPSAVFVIRRAIGRRGIPALHLMQKALDMSRQHFPTVFLNRFLSGWSSYEEDNE